MATTAPPPRAPAWLSADDCRLEDLLAVLDDQTRLEDYPHASRVEQQVLVYDAAALRTVWPTRQAPRGAGRARPRAGHGPGIVVFTGAFDDVSVVDRATAAFNAMIADQHSRGTAAGDHFAKPGANDRVWNALEKLAVTDPEAFVAYYANDILALAATAWLGPGLPGHLAGQRRQPRRRGPDGAPRLPPRLPVRRGVRGVPRARARALPGADAAGRGRPLRHAGRLRPDALPAAQPEVLARLRRLPAARVPGVLRRPPHPAATGQGRRGVLQPRAVPRGRVQPLERHQADGQPAADLVRLRPRHGDGRPRAHRQRRLCRAAGREGRRAHRSRRSPTSSPRAPRATPSRRTSTATSPSAASPRRPRPTWWPQAVREGLPGQELRARLAAQAETKLSH